MISVSAVPDISLGASKFKVGYVTLTTVLSGIVYHPCLALATINLSNKFEVFMSTHYEDTKERRYKIAKWDGLG